MLGTVDLTDDEFDALDAVDMRYEEHLASRALSQVPPGRVNGSAVVAPRPGSVFGSQRSIG
jgi:hypothetical protein